MLIPTKAESLILQFISTQTKKEISENEILSYMLESNISKDYAEKALEGCLIKGFIEKAGLDEEGNTLYKITESGSKSI